MMKQLYLIYGKTFGIEMDFSQFFAIFKIHHLGNIRSWHLKNKNFVRKSLWEIETS